MSEKEKYWYQCACGWEGNELLQSGNLPLWCPECKTHIGRNKLLDVSDEVVNVWELSLYQNDKVQSSYVENNLDGIMDIVREMDPDSGDSFLIECLEMTLGEYHNLSEFAGF